jgi:uncharacterized protein involved in exopolysaccharide biosynthesis
MGSVKSTSAKGFAKGMELVQNVEALKDQYVTDRAKHTSYLTEFGTGRGSEQLQLTQIITKAKPPVDPSGAGPWLTIIACTLLGFFFSACLVLLLFYYKAIINLER